MKFRVRREVSQENQKLAELSDKVTDVTVDILRAQGYQDFSFSVSFDPRKEINIEGKKAILEKKDELKKRITKALLSKTNMNFTVGIEKISENEIRAQNWNPVFNAVSNETKKNLINIEDLPILFTLNHYKSS